jgi:hypothetical protein
MIENIFPVVNCLTNGSLGKEKIYTHRDNMFLFQWDSFIVFPLKCVFPYVVKNNPCQCEEVNGYNYFQEVIVIKLKSC